MEGAPVLAEHPERRKEALLRALLYIKEKIVANEKLLRTYDQVESQIKREKDQSKKERMLVGLTEKRIAAQAEIEKLERMQIEARNNIGELE